jgi:hypothetical protein
MTLKALPKLTTFWHKVIILLTIKNKPSLSEVNCGKQLTFPEHFIREEWDKLYIPTFMH